MILKTVEINMILYFQTKNLITSASDSNIIAKCYDINLFRDEFWVYHNKELNSLADFNMRFGKAVNVREALQHGYEEGRFNF